MFVGVLISLLCVLTFNNGQQKPIPEFSRVNDVTSGSFCSFFRGLQENEKEEAACCGFSNYSYLPYSSPRADAAPRADTSEHLVFIDSADVSLADAARGCVTYNAKGAS